ncbi:hypothetical protein HNY73_012631 [Argiope bruennichi]|uniref:Uncharacterized protein n=1 Tax=Argiope bruennichi TaxID=94029 RepID=A0A8T0F1B4_ARGBR|nr:hypothetical protein HNY73_012631 [Argiope bruennichi]
MIGIRLQTSVGGMHVDNYWSQLMFYEAIKRLRVQVAQNHEKSHIWKKVETVPKVKIAEYFKQAPQPGEQNANSPFTSPCLHRSGEVESSILRTNQNHQ